MVLPSIRIAPFRFSAMVACTALLLAGCGGRERFPSLAMRPAERAFGTAQPADAAPVVALPAVPASASVVDRVSALAAQADAAHRAFESRRAAAARLANAARGAAPGSEAWSVAQVALAQLDSARSQGMVAMADLDHLLIAAQETAVTGPDSDLNAVRATQAQISAQIAGEDDVIASLRAQVAG
ncbi:MAG: hypothetical protein RIS94_1668 [Pseudomonadota bacterium]|jgi:hypothetical protein